MQITMLPLSDLHPDPKNPRTNSGAVEKVAESIRRYGFNVPIGINAEHLILAGHTRYLAASMLGLSEAPCVVLDHLTPEQQREYNIADNRAADFSFFDVGMLSELQEELDEEFLSEFDMESLLGGIESFDYDPTTGERAAPEKREGLDLAPFEKYQYVCVICRSTYDYTNLLERLGLENIQARYVGKNLKRGMSIGRIIEYSEFVRKVDGLTGDSQLSDDDPA